MPSGREKKTKLNSSPPIDIRNLKWQYIVNHYKNTDIGLVIIHLKQKSLHENTLQHFSQVVRFDCLKPLIKLRMEINVKTECVIASPNSYLHGFSKAEHKNNGYPVSLQPSCSFTVDKHHHERDLHP